MNTVEEEVSRRLANQTRQTSGYRMHVELSERRLVLSSMRNSARRLFARPMWPSVRRMNEGRAWAHHLIQGRVSAGLVLVQRIRRSSRLALGSAPLPDAGQKRLTTLNTVGLSNSHDDRREA